jgi:hypothetical protein
MRRDRLPTLLVVLSTFAILCAPSADAQTCSGFRQVVLFGSNSVDLNQGSEVLSGDVVANAASPGPTLGCGGRELCVGLGVHTPAGYAVKAQSIQIKAGAVVGGDLSYGDELVDAGTVAGTVTPGLGLPVFATLPAFAEAAPHPGAPDVLVPISGSTVLPPGDYGLLDVRQNGTVVFTGGAYSFGEIRAGLATDLLFQAPSEVRVAGRFDLSQGSVLGPQSGSGIDASDLVFHVAGVNGASGSLDATPKAATLGLATVVAANFYVPHGTLWIRQGATAAGAFLARDVTLGLGAEVALDSAFGDQPPAARSQTVATGGAAAIEIVISGIDPEGGDLAFAIDAAPGEGDLSTPEPIVPPVVLDPDTGEPVQPPVTSARVTYTPFAPAEDRADAFTFRVTDPCGGFGMAVVTINPPQDPTTPTPIEGTFARDGAAETGFEQAVSIVLRGDADEGVSLTFSIETDPGDGELSGLTQGSETPQRSAKVVYTPDPDFTGTDSFQFRVEDATDPGDFAVGTVTVAVFGALAEDQEVTTSEGQPVEITLFGNAGAGPRALVPVRGALTPRPRAAFLDGSEVAGNVADADGDGAGDNHNDLPGPVPVLVAAGVDLEGGPGSNGTARIQIEWDLGGLAGLADSLESAHVLLHTVKGTVDSLDTVFFVGTGEQDGLLTDADFAAPATPLAGVVMPVPDVPVGTEGTFSFDVTDELREALGSDRDVFAVQARVDEGLAGGGSQRGLQVRSSAAGNLPDFLHPQLSLATPGVTSPALAFALTALPAHGILVDPQGLVLTCAFAAGTTCAEPLALASPRLTYRPAPGFSGNDGFSFQVSDFVNVALADIGILVIPFDGCGQDGRPPGCGPAQCADGLDNDGDGKVDLADPQCSGSLDDSEAP